jgi:hypothetical protein
MIINAWKEGNSRLKIGLTDAQANDKIFSP